jgi:hypothetical protein
MRISRFARSEPPPARMIPLSTISAASSGGVFSSEILILIFVHYSYFSEYDRFLIF